MTRITVLKREQMTAEQGKVYDDVKAEGGPLGGPYWAYIRYPKLMRLLQDFRGCFEQSGLSKRERQIATMAVIRFWGAEFPWAVQVRNALEIGIQKDIVDTINAGGTPKLDDPRERMAYDVAIELLTSRKLRNASYARAAALFNEKELVSLVAHIGSFTTTCLTTIAFDCTPPADVPHRLKHQAKD